MFHSSSQLSNGNQDKCSSKVTIQCPNIMAMSTLLKSKFRGCLLGSLAGDCCGAPFEGDIFTAGSKIVLQNYFDKLEGKYFKAPVKKYTEDSSMTKCIAETLIEHPERLNTMKLAKSLTRNFLNDPTRGYNENLVVVFNKLRASKFSDPLGPARKPANYTNSSDNAAASRIAPLAMMFGNDYQTMIKMAKESIEITHTHREGVLGGLLQCITIQESLFCKTSDDLDATKFTEKLISKIASLEKEKEGMYAGTEAVFSTQLGIVKDLLNSKNLNVSDEVVLNSLGHNNRALFSVPTAIYCFLRAIKSIPQIETSNPFRRAVQYAISLGGDTDTIASMTGSITGAYYGEEILNSSLIKHCEGSEDFKNIADKLYKLSVEK